MTQSERFIRSERNWSGVIPMTYSDFTLETVRDVLGVMIQQGTLFEKVPSLEVPPWLQEALAKGMQIALLGEKVRSEVIVMPILLTSRELCRNRFSIYSGQRFDVDPAKGLVGQCDFILTTSPPVPLVQSPVMMLVEAKNGFI